MDRYRTLLENYYGVSGNGSGGVGESARVRAAKARDLNSESFNPEVYAQDLLMNAPLSQLLEEDDKLVHEVRTLDADMQLLVYDNYSKFIGATDTIRKMKNEVEQIEEKIDNLVSKMDSISNHANRVNEVLEPKRTKIEKLVRLQGLIGKLNFLFELPLKLKDCISENKLSEAVSYYKMAAPILEKYSHIGSFAAIARESKDMVKNLEEKLNEKLSEESQSESEFNKLVELLMDLHPDSDTLSESFVSWHSNRIRAVLNDFSEKKENISIKIGPFVEQITVSSLDSLVDTCYDYERIFLAKFSNDADEVRTLSESDGYESDDEEDAAIKDKKSDNEDEDENKLKLEEAKLRTRLGNFAKPLLAEYLTLIRCRFDEEKDTQVKPRKETKEGEEEEEAIGDEANSKYSEILGALNTLLQKMQCIRLSADVLPSGASLTDRATEIAEHAIRTQVVAAFDSLREKVKERIATVYEQMTLNSNQDKDYFGSHRTILDVSERISKEIKHDVEATMDELRELLSVAAVMLSELSAIFKNLVRFQLHHWILWMGNMLECQSDPFHALRAHELPPACSQGHYQFKVTAGTKADALISPLSHSRSIILVKMSPLSPVTPAFLLCLACIAKNMEIATQDTSISLGEIEDPELVKEMGNVKLALLTAYVDSAGVSLSEIVRRSIEEPWNEWLQVPEPSGVSEYAQKILLNIRHMKNCVQGLPVENGSSHSQSSGIQRGMTRRSSLPKASVQVDVERMFDRKTEIHGGISFNTESILNGTVKLVLKTILECVRLCTFGRNGFKQIQIDTFFVRSIVSLLVDDSSVANNLLGQIVKNAKDRCIDPELLNDTDMDFICRSARDSYLSNRN